MAFEIPSGASYSVVGGGPAGTNGRNGTDGTNGSDGRDGRDGDQGQPGPGTLATRTAATNILPSTYVVDQPGDTCVVADPTNLDHAGKVLGLVVIGVAQGQRATIQYLGSMPGVSGTFGPGDALYIGDGTTGRVGSVVNRPPAARSDMDVWEQQVGTATTTNLINGALGFVVNIPRLGATAIVGASGGFAIPATADDVAAGTSSTKWISPAVVTSYLAYKLRSFTGIQAPNILSARARQENGVWGIEGWINPLKLTDIRNKESTYDATADLQLAGADAEDIDLGFGGFNLKDKVSLAREGQIFAGRSTFSCVFSIGAGFNPSAAGFFELFHGCHFGNLRVDCAQPDTDDRSRLIQYPTIVIPGNGGTAADIHLYDIAIRRAMIGLDFTGNVYGRYGFINLQCFNIGMKVDGALEFWHADVIQGAAQGISDANAALPGHVPFSGLNRIYYDGYGFLFQLGGSDNCSIGALKSFSQPIIMDDYGNGVCTSNIGELALDTNFATLRGRAGKINVGTLISSKLGGNNLRVNDPKPAWSGDSAKGLSIEGAEVNVAAAHMFANGPANSPTIFQNAGKLSIAAGDIIQYGATAPAFVGSGGQASFGAGVTFYTSDYGVTGPARSSPLVAQTATCALHFDAKINMQGGSGVGLAFATDVAGNYMNPRKLKGVSFTLPSTTTNGEYGL